MELHFAMPVWSTGKGQDSAAVPPPHYPYLATRKWLLHFPVDIYIAIVIVRYYRLDIYKRLPLQLTRRCLLSQHNASLHIDYIIINLLAPEMDMGPYLLTQPNPTQQQMDPTQPNT